MSIRLPLPTRLSLQTLTGLRQAVSDGANSVANNVVTPANVLGYINAFEDDILSPLRLIWMRTTDYNITLDQYGTFSIPNALSQTCLEVVTVYSAGGGNSQVANTYWQYAVPFDRKDLNTFRKLQGNVNIEPIYTIDGNVVRVWPPVNYYGPLACSYYADWPRLGDLDTNSTTQQQTLVFSGTATAAGTLTFQTISQPTTVVKISNGDTAATVATNVLSANIVYEYDAGNNPIYWIASSPADGTVILTAPKYVSTAALTVTQTLGTGITFTNMTTRQGNLAYIQNNWFLNNYPYLYYYGSLKHVFLFLNDLERAKWASDQAMKYVSELQAISDRADVSDISDGPNYNQNIQW